MSPLTLIPPGVQILPAKEYLICSSESLKPLLSVTCHDAAVRYAQELRRSGMSVTIYKALED